MRRSEILRERLVAVGRKILVAEDDDLMVQVRLVDFVQEGGGQWLCQIEPEYLRANCAGQRLHRDVLVGHIESPI